MKLHLNPTNEQQNILNARGRIVKINARAGTGKTATLLMLAQANPGKRVLYLVFNSRNRQEAKGKFPDNVDIHTIHSFALSSLGSNFDGFDAVRPSRYLNNFIRDREVLATLTSDFIVFFLNSTCRKPEQAIDPFLKHLSDEERIIFVKSQDQIREIARDSLNSWYKSKNGCPHDFYLKLSHIQGNFQKKLDRYDLALVDEGQDLSPIMIDVLSMYKGRIIVVGDSHQQIYSFRYAQDAMPKFPHDELHGLTMSFRFGDKIAELTREFINNAKDDRDFTISGAAERPSHLFFYSDFDDIKIKPGTAILCRTNFSLFKNALYFKARRQDFFFERDISSELLKTLNVYWLSIEEKSKIRDELIQSFDNLQELEKFATKINDYQLQKIVELVRSYKSQFPGIVFEFLQLCEDRKIKKSRDAVTLSTIHAAKGQEYENVIIDEDVISKLEGADGGGESNNTEEINVVYVGITRAREGLYLPAGMKRLFNKQWQDYTRNIQLVRAVEVRRSVSDVDHISYRGNSSKGMTEKKIEALPVLPEFKIGDAVKTPNGYGNIVKIDGDLYLVAMENQIARIWERRSVLVDPQKVAGKT
jgi:superfamily I DNA/RNA helicase